MAEEYLIIKVQAEEIFFNQEEQNKIKALKKKRPKINRNNIAKRINITALDVVQKAWSKFKRATLR